jgi:hypothetical protein
MAPDVPRDTAVILAPLNCPSVRAKQADAMANELGQMGIPPLTKWRWSFGATSRDQVARMAGGAAFLGPAC